MWKKGLAETEQKLGGVLLMQFFSQFQQNFFFHENFYLLPLHAANSLSFN